MYVDYLILGASGLLGSVLLEHLPGTIVGTYCSRAFPGGLRLDFRDADAVARLGRTLAPRVIVNAAGMTRPDPCEADPSSAWRVNVAPLRSLAGTWPDARIVQFSTDYVFDGVTGGYFEMDPPRPVNAYGRSKLEAERVLLSLRPEALVLRVAGLFGWSRFNTDFLTPYLGDEPLACSVDHVSSWTYVNDVAHVLPSLEGWSGTVHLTGPDVLSRAQFARMLTQELHLSTRIVPLAGADAYRGAPRPINSSLRSSRLPQSLTAVMPALQALRRRLEDESASVHRA